MLLNFERYHSGTNMDLGAIDICSYLNIDMCIYDYNAILSDGKQAGDLPLSSGMESGRSHFLWAKHVVPCADSPVQPCVALWDGDHAQA